jgi:hypothetical protein
MFQTDYNRPPYVQWETRAVEDRTKSVESGHYVAKDVTFALIMRPGSRDRLEKEAEVWLTELKEKDRKGEIPPEWFPAFDASYKRWKAGEADPVNGTALKNWPALSPAQVQMITSNGILTVEDLAALPEGEVGSLGIGGITLRQKARSWLEAASDKGKLVEENAALKVQISDLAEQIKNLTEQFSKLKPKG